MFSHDISGRARLEKMKSDFINRASHELRTPLTGALLMCDLIDESSNEDERQEYWGHLRNELGRQRALVDRLLTVGRLETGSLKLNPEPLDLGLILKEAADTVYPLAKTSGIEIIQELETGLGPVVGDKGGLEQVFTNLVNNAVKFSQPGTTVLIHAETLHEGIQVTVEDHGVGIPAEDLPHLFEGFFRARNAVEKSIPGSGVGLYIVHSIIEELGGTVEVESQLNTGTRFKIWLPAARE
jgi:signal transduction histidine kinase